MFSAAASAGEKPDAVRTHLRNMLIVPEMIGSVIGVYNGKTFNQVRPSAVLCSGTSCLHCVSVAAGDVICRVSRKKGSPKVGCYLSVKGWHWGGK